MDLDLDFGTDEEVGEATRITQKRTSIDGGEHAKNLHEDEASTRKPKVAKAQKTNKRKSEHLHEHEASTPSKKRGSKAKPVRITPAARLDESRNKPITVGTDFSGLETPSYSLSRNGIHHKLIYACESNNTLLKLIRETWNPTHLYTDINSPERRSAPPVQLYVAGASCQPWSKNGLKQGRNDAQGRGGHLAKSVRFVVDSKPRAFVLENVDGLGNKTNEKELNRLLKMLEDNGFQVFHQTLPTEEHGIPQHTPRIYIVGFHGKLSHKFTFPEKLGHCLPLDALWDTAPADALAPVTSTTVRGNLKWAKKHLKADGTLIDVEAGKQEVILDVEAGEQYRNCMRNVCPCITRSRGNSGGYYIMSLGRRTSVTEMGRLQGFSDDTLAVLSKKLGRSALGAALGNAMSMNVLDRLLPRVCFSAGFIKDFKDPRLDAKYNPTRDLKSA